MPFQRKLLFRNWSTFWEKGYFWFSAWFVWSEASGAPQFRTFSFCMWHMTIHHAETLRSDRDIPRPKSLCKSNVSSNARCFRKRLHSLSSFLVVHPCSSNYLFGSALSLFVQWMRDSHDYSKIIRAAVEGVSTNSAMPSAFFPDRTWSLQFCLPNAYISLLSDSESTRAIPTSSTLSGLSIEPVGSAWFPPKVTVDVGQKSRCQSNIDHRNMFGWTNKMCLDASVWFCGLTNQIFVSQPNLFQYLCFLSNLCLQHSGKVISQLSCRRHDLHEKGMFHVQGHVNSGKAQVSAFLVRDRHL